MHEDWSYRKIKVPPVDPTGHWRLMDFGTGEISECADITPLLKRLVRIVAGGNQGDLQFVPW